MLPLVKYNVWVNNDCLQVNNKCTNSRLIFEKNKGYTIKLDPESVNVDS